MIEMVEIMNFGLILIKNILVVGLVGIYWLILFSLVKIFSQVADKIFK